MTYALEGFNFPTVAYDLMYRTHLHTHRAPILERSRSLEKPTDVFFLCEPKPTFSNKYLLLFNKTLRDEKKNYD